MARLISCATGNLTTSTTWAVSNATAILDSQAGNTVLTTSYVASANIATGIITVDAILVKVALRTGTTGTMSVELYNASLGASVAGTEVSMNTADIAAGTTAALGGCGWYAFKFASSVTLLAATNYQVRAKTSSANQINLFRDGTAGNWSRQLRTTTNAAPGAADLLDIVGEQTGAGTGNDFTVTMNETATTDYGAITLSKRGTLTWGTTASTNYYLKTSGVLNHYGDATLNYGTSGTPMPSTSTGILEFDSTSAAEFGYEIRGGAIFNMYGNPITNIKAKLNADAAAAATSLTTDISTAWLNGDEIGIASTTRTAAEGEKKSLTAGASGTTLTISALTNAHSGTSPTQAELVNLTRNIKLRGVSAANSGYINIAATAVVNVSYGEFYQLGSTTIGKKGIDVITTTGNFNFTGSSIHDCTNTGSITLNCVSATGTGINVTNLVMYGNLVGILATGAAVKTFNNVTVIRCTGGTGFSSNNAPDLLTDITITSCTGTGFSLVDADGVVGTLTGIVSHSNSTDGYSLSGLLGSIGSLTCWRNNSNGCLWTLSGQGNLSISSYTAFGNLTDNLQFLSTGGSGITIFSSVTLNGGVTLTCPVGITLNGSAGMDVVIFESASIGATTTHSTGDLSVAAGFNGRLLFQNSTFGSTTEISGQANVPNGYFMKGIASQKHDGSSGSNRTWQKYGTVTTDTTIFRTASPSQRGTPISAAGKTQAPFLRVPVNSGATVTVSAYVRCSVVGDGTAYNGARPRLIVRRNSVVGVSSDTVLATATGASDGAFELLTGTTVSATEDGCMDFFIDCDGTTGWVNVDDVSTTTANNMTGLKYWMYGAVQLGQSSGGGSFTFS